MDFLNFALTFFAMQMVCFLNIFLVWDLVMMLRYPFKPSDMRLTFAIIYSVVVTSIMYILWALPSKLLEEVVLYWMVTNAFFYLGAAFISLMYSCYKLNSQSISKEIGKTIFKRHLLSTMVFILCNIYLYLGFVYAAMDPKNALTGGLL